MNELTKPISVGLLLAFIAAMDLLHINDPELRYACFGLISLITGWHAVTNRRAIAGATPVPSAGYVPVARAMPAPPTPSAQ
ncbi:hypothetical protein [Paraburkholderia saeva]|uniref:Uncharacterized protein n=1 Tax=Paraburkholderia saeva TaxID=2777537 RepID=A0A9N8RZ28_9BURK|nr:hypothetical protein [Paraburkholderia saeva]CAG4905950.1 hypothetical protein LMG31841_03507 [Paraburkholderia saeva]